MKYIAACLFLLPCVFALDIANFGFSGQVTLDQGKTYVLADRCLQVNFNFDLAPGVDIVGLDFGTLVGYQYGCDASGTRWVSRASAFCNGGHCSFPLGIYVPKAATTPVLIQVYSTTTQTAPFTFYQDAQPPVLKGIGTPTCKTSCSLKTGVARLTAYFTESSGIDTNTAILYLPRGTTRPDSCTKDTCTYTVNVPVGSTEYGPVHFSPQTSDLSGNKLGDTADTIFTIDEWPPDLLKVEISGTKVLSAPDTITGAFTYRVTVDDESPVSAQFDISDFMSEPTIKTVQCTNNVCSLQVTPKKGSYIARTTIVVTDSGGNQAAPYTDVRQVVSEVSTEEGADVWLLYPSAQPTRMDVATAALFDKRFFITLNPQGDGTIAYTQINSCWLQDGSNIIRTSLKPEIVSGTDNPTISVTLSPAADSNPERFVGIKSLAISCTVSLTTIQNGVLFETPEEETFSVPIELVTNPLAPQKLDAIKEKVAKDYNEQINNYNTVASLVKIGMSICSITGALTTASTAATSASGAIYPIAPPFSFTPANALAKVGDGIDSTVGKFAKSEFGVKFCNTLLCRGEGVLPNFYDKGFQAANENKIIGTAFAATGVTSQQVFNPYNSEILAYSTMCMPAILYHKRVKLATECSYKSCIEDETRNGVPIAACGEQKAIRTCQQNAMDIFWVSGGGLLQSMRDNVLSVISSPFGIIGYSLPFVCNVVEWTPAKAVCKLPKLLQDFSHATSDLRAMSDTYALFNQEATPSCDAPIAPPYGLPYGTECGVGYCCYQGYCKEAGASEYYRLQNVPGAGGYGYPPPQPNQPVEKIQTSAPCAPTDNNCKSAAISRLYGVPGATMSEINTNNVPGEVQTILDQAIEMNYVRGGIQLSDVNRLNVFGETTKATEQLQRDLANAQKIADQIVTDYGATCEGNDCPTPYGNVADILTWCSNNPSDCALHAKADKAYNDKYVGANIAEGILTSDAYNSLSDVDKQEIQRLLNCGNVQECADASKAARAALDKIEMQMYQNRLSTDTKYLLSQSMSTALAFKQVASMFGSIGSTQLFDTTNVLDLQSEFINRVCSNKLPGRDGASNIGMNQNEAIGLYLQGSRTKVSDVNAAGGRYQYLVRGTISVSEPREVIYSIYLDGDGRSASLYDGDLLSTPTTSWHQGGELKDQSDAAYTHVCITFSTSIRDLFESTTNTGSTACVPIVAVQE